MKTTVPGRKPYDDAMAKAAATPLRTAREALVKDIVNKMRRDLRIPALTLCAFLQDHAKAIKEIEK